MKTKSFKKVLGLCLGAAITLASCSPESPSNEKEHKLHEDPVRAVFTLQEGTLNGEGKFDAKPQISDFKSNGTPAQVIEYQTTEAEGWKITSTNAKFVVKNTTDNPDVVYQLKMDYYNAKGEMMNSQFFLQGQDKIHQHFFSTFKQVEVGGEIGSVRVTDKNALPYDYRYADQLNGSYIGDTNPMGFDGFIRFTKPGKSFQLSVDLLHAAVSKFDENNQPSPFYSPARVLLSTGLWDISVKLPIEVQGEPQEAESMDESLFKPAKVVIEIYGGHTHGDYAFHENPMPAQNKYLGKNYKITYWLDGNKWVADKENPERVCLTGSKAASGVAAFSLRYYNKNDEDITSELVINNEDKHYQHFFMAEQIEPSYGGKAETTDKNSTDFFKYLYCDTNPWNKTHKFDGAQFTGANNPVGIKGYFTFLHSHKKFNLNIKLMRAKNTKLVDGKPSPFYAPTTKQLNEESWMPTISVPMNIYLDASELELEADLFDAEELSYDESTYEESDRNIIHALMEAFGIKDFSKAIAEFYWNINGERKEDNTGFWF